MQGFRWKYKGLLVALLALLGLCGCAGRSGQFDRQYGSENCQQAWQAQEEAIHGQQVADPATVRVKGYPYLRSNRFLQALAARAQNYEEQDFVLAQMRQLDLQRRQGELGRLTGPNSFDLAELDSCSRQFLSADKERPAFFNQVREGIALDRDYSLGLRSSGLYPLTSWLVDLIAENAQDEMVSQLTAPLAAGARISFGPPQVPGPDKAEVQAILARSRRPPFLSLDISAEDKLRLSQLFAPLITVPAEHDFDRFGRVIHENHEFRVVHLEPAVYFYLDQSFIRDQPALQINYVIWFNERSDPAPWFEHGSFDGLNFRITLDHQGQPIFVDVMLNCGCYHFVLHHSNEVIGPRADAPGYVPFVGGYIPALSHNERLQFIVNSGWHQIGRVQAATQGSATSVYSLVPYGELEYMAVDGQHLSLFNANGRIAGSERLERFFLFGMGIPKVGSMRQRGRQPITLIGRAYFDDPYLFDKAFSYKEHATPLKVLQGGRDGATAGKWGGQKDQK